MKINERFLFFQKRSAFELALNSGSIDDQAIAFIAEDHVIWTHGIMFGDNLPNLESYATKEYVLEIVNDVEPLKALVESLLGDYLKNKKDYVVLEESEYNALEKYNDNTIYFVLEPLETSWSFGDPFPITLT